MDRLVKSLSLALVVMLGAGNALAQTARLRDPTLPPAAFLNPGEVQPDQSAELRLEAIRRPHGGVALALINGQLYRAGDEIGGRRLLSIGVSDVSLRGAGGSELLRMTPTVGKVMAGTPKRPIAEKKAGQ